MCVLIPVQEMPGEVRGESPADPHCPHGSRSSHQWWHLRRTQEAGQIPGHSWLRRVSRQLPVHTGEVSSHQTSSLDSPARRALDLHHNPAETAVWKRGDGVGPKPSSPAPRRPRVQAPGRLFPLEAVAGWLDATGKTPTLLHIQF